MLTLQQPKNYIPSCNSGTLNIKAKIGTS